MAECFGASIGVIRFVMQGKRSGVWARNRVSERSSLSRDRPRTPSVTRAMRRPASRRLLLWHRAAGLRPTHVAAAAWGRAVTRQHFARHAPETRRSRRLVGPAGRDPGSRSRHPVGGPYASAHGRSFPPKQKWAKRQAIEHRRSKYRARSVHHRMLSAGGTQCV